MYASPTVSVFFRTTSSRPRDRMLSVLPGMGGEEVQEYTRPSRDLPAQFDLVEGFGGYELSLFLSLAPRARNLLSLTSPS